jgi:hypothetical protein
MGIETLLFISLAVTFILIIMLVYHFQTKFDSLEHRTESLLEIINNVVKELKQVKIHTTEFLVSNPNSESVFPTVNTNIETMQIDLGNTAPIHTVFLNTSETVTLDEEDDDSDDDDDEDDDDDDDDDEDDDDDDDDDETIHSRYNDDDNCKTINYDKIVVSDNEDLDIDVTEIIVNKSQEENTQMQEPTVTLDNYKKLDIHQLRDLAVERSLIQDAKKKNFKKAELITLLEKNKIYANINI